MSERAVRIRRVFPTGDADLWQWEYSEHGYLWTYLPESVGGDLAHARRLANARFPLRKVNAGEKP